MKVKLDEALSGSLAQSLRAKGYETVTVLGQGWGGFKDPMLWPLVKAEGVFFITADKGFGDIRVYPPGSHPGILVLRPDTEGLSNYAALLDDVLEHHRLESLAGFVSVASSRGVRARRG